MSDQDGESLEDLSEEGRWHRLFRRLDQIEDLAEQPRLVTFSADAGPQTVGGLMGAKTITADQGTTLSIEETDDQGNVVPFTGAVAPWTADDNGAVVALTPSADNTKVNVAAVGPAGSTANVSTTLSGITDAQGNPVTDPSGNPLQIPVTEAVTVVPGTVSAAQVTASDPWSKSAPPTI